MGLMAQRNGQTPRTSGPAGTRSQLSDRLAGRRAGGGRSAHKTSRPRNVETPGVDRSGELALASQGGERNPFELTADSLEVSTTSARRPAPGVSTFCAPDVGQSILPTTRVSTFLPGGASISAFRVAGLQAGPPCPTSRFGRTGDVKIKKSYAPLFQTLTPIYPCQAARKIRPLLLQCKQKVVREKHLGGTKINAIPPSESWKQQKGDDESGESGQTRSGARLQTCRVAIRLSCPRASDFAGDISSQHIFAGWSKVPASLPLQPLRRC